MEINKEKISFEKLSPILITMIQKNIDVTLTITGNSMYPLLTHKRDSVILTRCDNRKLKKGDIPLYKRSSGQYVLHRIVMVNEDSYNLCGDNQYIIEKNIPKENIIAVVKAFERNGKLLYCNDFSYKVYFRFRVFLIPFRRFLHMISSKVRRRFQ